MSLLRRSEVLGMMITTLTANDMYSCHYRENFAQPIQMQFPKKIKIFPANFIAFLKST